MALPGDLIEQALHLATRDRTRPKQANLRRAASAAYYALFHHLVAAASRFLVAGESPGRGALRAALSRAFNHARMKSASEAFSRQMGDAWIDAIGYPVPPELVDVASAFVELQEARHEADYNPARCFARLEVLDLVDLARTAMADWDRIKEDPAADAYLLALLLKTRR